MAWEDKPWGKVLVDDKTGAVITQIIKDRCGYVTDEDFSLDPGTLVGSAFHVVHDDTIIWQGVVVAEPQPGRYLCQLDKLEEGATNVQRVFSLDTLMGLGEDAKRLLEGAMADVLAPVINPRLEVRFYDNGGAAQDAFRAWAAALHRYDRDEGFDVEQLIEGSQGGVP